MATTISEILGREAVPLRVEHAGRVYAAQPCSLEFMTAVERHLEERHKRAVLGLAGEVSDGVLAILLEPHTRKVRDKAFRWGGPEYLAWITSEQGGFEFSCMIFGLPEAEMLPLLLAKGREVAMIVEQVMVESLPEAVQAAVAKALREKREKERAAEKGEERPPTPAPQA